MLKIKIDGAWTGTKVNTDLDDKRMTIEFGHGNASLNFLQKLIAWCARIKPEQRSSVCITGFAVGDKIEHTQPFDIRLLKQSEIFEFGANDKMLTDFADACAAKRAATV